MSNSLIDSIPPHYRLPAELYERPGRPPAYDTAHWVMEERFFIGSAIKYTFRGWDRLVDIEKAINCLRLDALYSKGEDNKYYRPNYVLAQDLTFYEKAVDYPIAGKWEVLKHIANRDFLTATRLMEVRVASLRESVRHAPDHVPGQQSLDFTHRCDQSHTPDPLADPYCSKCLTHMEQVSKSLSTLYFRCRTCGEHTEVPRRAHSSNK